MGISFKKLVLVSAVGLGLSVVASDNVEALTPAPGATGSIHVSANIDPNCSVSTAAVTFAGYDGTAAVTGSGTVSVKCDAGASVYVGLDEGANSGVGSTAGSPIRRLKSAAGTFVSYDLRQPDNTTNWGNDTSVAMTGLLNVTGSGSLDAYTVNGTVAASGVGALPAGSYTDDVGVTVYY